MRAVVIACMVILAVAICGCGSDISSPQHVGYWIGDIDQDKYMTLDVSGEPGHYTADVQAFDVMAGADKPTIAATFDGGEVDSIGSMTFDDSHGMSLSLSAVQDGTMTADLDGLTVELRQ